MRLVPAALIALVCAAAGPAAADRYALTYDSAALGVIDLGDVTIDAEVTADSYEISATLKSGGLLALFEPTDIVAKASGQIDGGVVRWRSYELDHHYSK